MYLGIKYVSFTFPLHFCLKYLHKLGCGSAKKHAQIFMYCVCFCCPILTTIGIGYQCFLKLHEIKFHGHPFRHTDSMTVIDIPQ